MDGWIENHILSLCLHIIIMHQYCINIDHNIARVRLAVSSPEGMYWLHNINHKQE